MQAIALWRAGVRAYVFRFSRTDVPSAASYRTARYGIAAITPVPDAPASGGTGAAPAGAKPGAAAAPAGTKSVEAAGETAGARVLDRPLPGEPQRGSRQREDPSECVAAEDSPAFRAGPRVPSSAPPAGPAHAAGRACLRGWWRVCHGTARARARSWAHQTRRGRRGAPARRTVGRAARGPIACWRA